MVDGIGIIRYALQTELVAMEATVAIQLNSAVARKVKE